jgi:hypothetical protein
MPTIRWNAETIAARNAQLLAAERDRDEATHDAEIEYSETVSEIREHYETELAEAGLLRLARITPAQHAYNVTVVAAEHGQEPDAQ